MTRVLVVNAGSSSVKLRVLDAADNVVWKRNGPTVSDLGVDGIRELLADAPAADAAGHRIVHGGARFAAPVRLDDDTVDQLTGLTRLAPLHQPPALEMARILGRLRPDLPAVACFDTAFHRTLPAAAATYPLPGSWRQRYALRRYGFHGLSHAWVARRAPQLVGHEPAEWRIVSCHLGAGASLAAVSGGRCVDTTMGFTPLEGLVMTTRSGSVDPGLILWLINEGGLPPSEVEDGLVHRSGLHGLAGTTRMDEIAQRAAAGDPDAALARDVYQHRLRAGIAAMTAALGGLDVLVFTGGIGEHVPAVRADAAAGLGFLGVAIDQAANDANALDAEITAPGAAIRVLAVRAREDLEIARGVRAIVGRS